LKTRGFENFFSAKTRIMLVQGLKTEAYLAAQPKQAKVVPQNRAQEGA
jgi:hypothetical protein